MKIFKIIVWLLAITLLGYGIKYSCEMYDWTGLDFFPFPYQYYLVPGIAALVSACILSFFSKWNNWHLLHISASVGLILYFGLPALLIDTFISVPTKKIAHYESIVESSSEYSDIGEYFPKMIPEYATNVNFYYRSTFWGPGVLILRYNAPAEKIESYYQKFSNIQRISWKDADEYQLRHLDSLFDINDLKENFDLLDHKVIISKKKNEIIFFDGPHPS